WSCESGTDSVEHSFFQVKPDDGGYEFWVTGDNIGSHYAVAWCALGGIVEQRPSLGQNSVETVRQITSSLLSGLQSRSQNVVSDDLDPAVIFSRPTMDYMPAVVDPKEQPGERATAVSTYSGFTNERLAIGDAIETLQDDRILEDFDRVLQIWNPAT